MTDKYWYAVYTKSKLETKVSKSLSRQNIENFCPLNKVTMRWAERTRIINEPLFSGFVFARVGQSEHKLLTGTQGVLSLLHWLDQPAVIRDAEIQLIKDFVSSYSNIKLEKLADEAYQLTDLVKQVTDMATLTIKKEYESNENNINSSVRVILPSLNYRLSATVETGETVSSNTQYRYRFFRKQGVGAQVN